jgi:hypothetical protein
LFGLGHWPTGNGRSPWARQSRMDAASIMRQSP